VEATLRLGRRAAAAGIRRFVYISSIKVNGESTPPGKAFTEADLPQPQDPYALSKYEAERGLMDIANETGLEVVIVRPPLVYGQGVGANFAALARAVQLRWPLPLGAVDNKRSLVSVDNLADFIAICLTAPQASNQVFVVCDEEDLSSAELCRRLARAAGVRAYLFSVPVWLLKGIATLFGVGAFVGRLCESLQVDASKARQRLGWVAPFEVQAGLERVYVNFSPPVFRSGALLRYSRIPKFGFPLPPIKRITDIILTITATAILIFPVAAIALSVRLTSNGPILYWSDRVGRHNRIFKMPKFRTMRVDTPTVATHLLVDAATWLTPIGAVLRKSSLDELPQLWSILIGDMTLVGPRPALFNQSDLIALRTEHGVHRLTPGLTGWAQVNGRDELPIPQKVQFDVEYLSRQSFSFDIYILWLTVLKVVRGDGVVH
jgi:lipopolysaccharide/colanic/teichoic acid biosynthesis glycosyltransferase/uncharacterized protein YbjT (DUF2867 family)